MPDANPALLLWFGAFFLTSAGGGLYFWFGTNASNKRQLYPWYSLFSGVLFLGFVFFSGAPPAFLIFAIPAVAWASYAHARTTVFCPRCARMIYRGRWLNQTNFCPRCGQALDQSLHQPDFSP